MEEIPNQPPASSSSIAPQTADERSRIQGCKPPRSSDYPARRHCAAISLAFTIAMVPFAVIAIACIVALPAAMRFLPVLLASILDIARWPVLAVLIALALACLYRFGPSRREPRFRWISWGSAFVAIGGLIVSALSSYYAANFGTFNQTYGSIGAVIGFMLWIWLSVIVILLGAKLDAEIERQTAQD